MGNRIHRFQLTNSQDGRAISAAGGVVKVTAAGTPDKVALQNKDGTAASNPATLTNGQVVVRVADTVESVDMFILSPTGHFIVLEDVKAGDRSSVNVDAARKETTYVIPFDVTDSDITAAVEFDTGFDLPANHMVMPDGVGVFIETLEATETMGVGLLAAESGGDADGFMALLDVAAAGFIRAGAVVTAGGSETYLSASTLGALLADFVAGANTATDVGTNNLKEHVGDGTAESISLTLTAGSALVAGYIFLPVRIGLAT